MRDNASADLVIMGAGAAGLSAGARAASLGLHVIVLEAADIVGGSMLLSNGNLWAPITLEGMHERGGVGDLRLASMLIEDYAAAVEFVAALGALSSSPTASADGVGTGRFMDVPGFLARAVEVIEAAGGEVRTDVAVGGLLTDGESVIGVSAQSGTKRYELRGTSVLLAGGGFQASTVLLQAYIHPQAENLLLRSNPYSVGTGLELALTVGAVLSRDMDAFYGHLVCWPVDQFEGQDLMDLAQYHSFQCLLLDVNGRRFTDESLGDSFSNQEVLRLPGSRALLVAPDAVRRNPGVTTLQMPRFDKFELAAARGARVASAASAAALGAAVSRWGFDAQGVVETIEEFSHACERGIPLVPPRRHNREPFLPPLHGMEVRPSISNTNGGPRIDIDARVIRANGQPIPGLLAAGVDAGNVFGRGYAGGLANAIVYGLRAANTATDRTTGGCSGEPPVG